MNIELRNIKVAEYLSQETTAFAAFIFIDGVKVGTAENDGHGGCTRYGAIGTETRHIIEKAEEYCLGLPAHVVEKHNNMEEYSYPMNMEHFIDNLVEAYLVKKDQEKFEKKMQKEMVKSIVYGVPNGDSYRMLTFKRPLSEMLLSDNGKLTLAQHIRERVLPKCKDGVTILNTNLPIDILSLTNC